MEGLMSNSRLPVRIVSVVMAVLAFALSMFFYKKIHDRDRKLLYFPSYDGDGIYSEPRYLMKNPDGQAALADFVDDLLLGPMTNRYGRIFPRGTRAEYCFTGEDGEGNIVLYLGLSRDALFAGDLLSVREEVDLLKLNIVKNFTYLNKIDVSIDGISVYE